MKRRMIFLVLFIFILTSCSTETEEPSSSTPDIFIAVHLESGANPKTTLYPEKYWPALVELVEVADKSNIKLTLEFNPQWGTYILEDSEKVDLLRSWEAAGHEIAVHHHGPHHGSWNGYTNQEEYKDDSEYIGSIEEMMDILNQLPSDGNLYTGAISKEEDKDLDWPEGIIYSTEGGANGEEDLLSLPTVFSYNGIEGLNLQHATYAIGKTDVSLSQIADALENAKEEEVLGIVFHVHDFEEKPKIIQTLFELFESKNAEVKTVKDIFSSFEQENSL